MRTGPWLAGSCFTIIIARLHAALMANSSAPISTIRKSTDCFFSSFGPYRIMVSTLRRISRTTNRYVPVYVGQEFDDRTYPPTRVYPPIDTGLMETE